MSPPEVEPLVCRKYEIKRRLGKGVSAWRGGGLWEMGWAVVDRVFVGAGLVVGPRGAGESWRGPCGVQGTVRAPGGPRELRGCLGVQEPMGTLSLRAWWKLQATQGNSGGLSSRSSKVNSKRDLSLKVHCLCARQILLHLL